MSFPEAELPLEYIPDNIYVAGPLVLDVAPAETQSAELAAWVKKAPTMLINLGSAVRYEEPMAQVMADAIVLLLDKDKDVQVLWKMQKEGEFGDDFLQSARKYIEGGRLRLESWLEVDPTSLFKTGAVVASVHHGGANCFYEAILCVFSFFTPRLFATWWSRYRNIDGTHH